MRHKRKIKAIDRTGKIKSFRSLYHAMKKYGSNVQYALKNGTPYKHLLFFEDAPEIAPPSLESFEPKPKPLRYPLRGIEIFEPVYNRTVWKFEDVYHASQFIKTYFSLDINMHNIIDCANGNRGYAGRLPNGQTLKWRWTDVADNEKKYDRQSNES